MSFEVHQPNLNNMQEYLNKEKERQKDYGDGPNWWSIPSGMSSIRILPPWDATGRIALPVYMHPIEYKAPDWKYTKYNWTCVNKTFGRTCNICEALKRMQEAGITTDEYEANRRQFYFNAIVMYDPIYDADFKRGKKPEDCSGVAPGTHVLLKAPKTLYDWVIAQITNPMIGDITNLEHGIDIYVTKEGSGLGTKYTPTLSPNGRTPVPQEYLSKIEALYNLDEIFGSGFSDEDIKGLIGSLNGSAAAVAQNMTNTVNQMAGYQQNQGYPSQMQVPPSPGNMMPPVNQMPVIPTPPAYSPISPTGTTPAVNPYQTTATPPQGAPIPPSSFVEDVPFDMTPVRANPAPAAPVTPTIPTQPQSTGVQAQRPACFGQYNAANVTCVVCPHEIECSKRG